MPTNADGTMPFKQNSDLFWLSGVDQEESKLSLSVMKGGGPANMLVKALDNDLGKKMYGNTLVENVGQAIYKDKDAIERSIKGQFPMFKATQEFEYGFKIRDKENPKDWYLAKDIQVIPPVEELGNTPVEKMGNFFQDLGKNLGL